MNVKELIEQLEKFPPEARVHVEVMNEHSPRQHYGHALGATRSEPNVIVISNRLRDLGYTIPTNQTTKRNEASDG